VSKGHGSAVTRKWVSKAARENAVEFENRTVKELIWCSLWQDWVAELVQVRSKW